MVDDAWKPLAFFSKKLKPAETRYSAFDRELLAVYLAIKHFRHFLEGRNFHVFTDHKPLTFTFKNNSQSYTPRQFWHLDYISQFTTDLRHVKGLNNGPADALSRSIVNSIEDVCFYEKLPTLQADDDELQQLTKSPSLQMKKITLPNCRDSIYCDLSTGSHVHTYLHSYDSKFFQNSTTCLILGYEPLNTWLLNVSSGRI